MKPIGHLGLQFGLVVMALIPLSAQTPADPTFPLVSPLKTPERSMICGTTILSGNAASDPLMPKRLPPGNFTMRVIQPKTCAGNNAAAANESRFPQAVHPGDFLNRLPTFLGPKR